MGDARCVKGSLRSQVSRQSSGPGPNIQLSMSNTQPKNPCGFGESGLALRFLPQSMMRPVNPPPSERV